MQAWVVLHAGVRDSTRDKSGRWEDMGSSILSGRCSMAGKIVGSHSVSLARWEWGCESGVEGQVMLEIRMCWFYTP